MLVAPRKVDQSIVVGDEYVITVTKIYRDRIEALVENQWDGRSTIHQLELNKSFQLAPGMVITVVDVHQDVTRLAFEVPRGTSLYRKEILDGHGG